MKKSFDCFRASEKSNTVLCRVGNWLLNEMPHNHRAANRMVIDRLYLVILNERRCEYWTFINYQENQQCGNDNVSVQMKWMIPITRLKRSLEDSNTVRYLKAHYWWLYTCFCVNNSSYYDCDACNLSHVTQRKLKAYQNCVVSIGQPLLPVE